MRSFKLMLFSLVLNFFLGSQAACSYSLFHYDLPDLNTAIGTMQFSRIDSSRVDPHTNEGFMRELVYRVWYPAEENESLPLSNWGYEDRDLIFKREALEAGIPQFLVASAHLGQVRSKIGLKPKAGSYPVVLLLKGLGPDRIEGNTDLAEYLVSKGFIVVGISIPFGSGYLKISQVDHLIEYGDEIQEIMSRYPASRPEMITYRLKEHDLWVKDILFTLESLTQVTEPILKYTDWRQIYLLGHSHGGIVALEACTKLTQCKASVNMDGFTYELKTPLDYKKHLALYVPSSGDYMRTYCDGKIGCVNREILCDIGHGGFTDSIYVKWPFTHFTKNYCGSDSIKIKADINQMIAEFFINKKKVTLMLENPNLSTNLIVSLLQEAYSLNVSEVKFLPLGNDQNTLIYEAVTFEGSRYFLKLRRSFDEASVLIPRYLSEKGIKAIISPIMTQNKKLSTKLDEYSVVLYPYIKGEHGFKVKMTENQCHELGESLRSIHSVELSEEIKQIVRQETFTPNHLIKARELIRKIESETFTEPIAAEFANFVKSKAKVIEKLLQFAEYLEKSLKSNSASFSLCHSDIHAYNLLIESKDKFYIVDWDDPILAPKERDLMFVGYGMGLCDSKNEMDHFFQGYGKDVIINQKALAYYRCERIIQDFVEYSEFLLLTDKGGEDRAEGLRLFKEQFELGKVVDVAIKTSELLQK